MARVEIPFTVEKVVASNLQPVSGASVQINVRGGGAATVYAAEAGGGTTANPMTTDANGRIEGWLDEGSYNLIASGAGFTTYTQPFDAASAVSALALDGTRIVVGTISGSALIAGSTSGTKLTDGTVTAAKLDPNVLPIGTVLDWWRPSNSVSVPTGWVQADGSTYSAANHSYPGGGSITVPDLRNSFILGANTANADGAAPTGSSDAVGSAPGIGGVGGSHFRNLQHAHTNNAHTHTGLTDSQGDHTHFVSITSGGMNFVGSTVGGAYASSFENDINHTHAVKGNTSNAGTHLHNVVTVDASDHGMNQQLSTTQDIKPKLVGLLKIIKIKNS